MNLHELAFDLALLSAVERRIGLSPHAVLEIARHASIAETCDAYARLAHACDPRRFAADPQAASRARRATRHLRLAFHAAIRRDLGPPARRGARAALRPGLVT